MVHNVTSGVDLKQATEELNQFSRLMGMILGMTAPKVSSPSKTIHKLTSSSSVPGTGIEHVRPLRGSGFLRSGA
jgi:hypothetical protein